MVIPREPPLDMKLSNGGLRRDCTQAPLISKAYLVGVLHDATARKTTFRIATKSKDFAEVIQRGIINLGRKAWIYKEGKSRDIYIVEFSKSILNNTKLESKKDKYKLLQLKKFLSELGILSGKVHNPSNRVDPNYWRFYISVKSYGKFAQIIGSSHPEKQRYLRMKI